MFSLKCANRSAISNRGDPFENDKEWIPAHRLCTTKCDIHVDICMKNVKSDKQRCQKLPADCIKGLKNL
ncbi:hypothetical protein QQG55_39980 [Brugia pahangi]